MDPLGPHASRNGKRSSDKGFLAMAEAEYLDRHRETGSISRAVRVDIISNRGSGNRERTYESVVSPCFPLFPQFTQHEFHDDRIGLVW